MPAEVFNHATLSALFRYWDKKRADRAMPARRDIDPIEMGPKLLPHLMLCELADHADRIKFRLVGTFLVKRLGYDPTGHWLSELPKSDYLDFLAKAVRQTYAQVAPLYAGSNFRWGAKSRMDAHHVLLPLTNGGGADPAMVLVGTSFVSEELFPPQIRVLDNMAQHHIGRRETIETAPAAAWHEIKAAVVA